MLLHKPDYLSTRIALLVRSQSSTDESQLAKKEHAMYLDPVVGIIPPVPLASLCLQLSLFGSSSTVQLHRVDRQACMLAILASSVKDSGLGTWRPDIA
jgi:hypothetical protein